MDKKKKLYAFLWILTAIAVLTMLLATLQLAQRSREYANIEVAAFITGTNSSIYLRERPGVESKIITIVERDSPALIKNATEGNSKKWYFVQIEEHTGWIPAENISLSQP